MLDTKLEERKNNYKKVNYGLLEAREKFKLTLRKQKIDDIIYERRDVSNSTLFIDNSDKKNYEIDPTKLKIDQELLKKNFNSLEDLILFTKYLITNDDDLDCIKFGIYLLRTSHSRTKNIPVEFLKKEGICDSLNKTLKKYFTELDIIFEILWIFTNISCVGESSNLKFFVEEDYSKNYIMIFNNYEKEVRIIEQLIWHLGNVLGSRDITDIIIENKIFDKVYDLLNRQAINEKIVKISVWFIANVAKLKLFDNQIVLDKCVQILMLFIKTDDIELLSDCLWGLSYVSETENKELIEYMISERLSEYLFMLNLDGRDNLILPVIRVTGNLLSNESNYVDTLIKQGCIKYLDQFISHQNNQIRRESLWAISNIAGGTNSQLSALLQSNIIQKIFSLVKDPDSDVVNEVMWCIGNILNSSNIENCVKLVDMNVFEPILYILSNFLNPATLILCISALSKLLEHGKYSGYHHDYNPFVKIFSEKGGLEIIDKLQYHKNEKIYALVSNLLDNYFSDFITKINDPI